jgi:hypothetical protein
MPKRIDITGQRFGRLIALIPAPEYKGKDHWECKCDCGNKAFVSSYDLRTYEERTGRKKRACKECGWAESGKRVGKLGRKPLPNIDWSSPEWCYLLGVIHGDGCIRKGAITVTIAKNDSDYAESLIKTLNEIDVEGKFYENSNGSVRVDIHSIALSDHLKPYKSLGIWDYPKDFLASGSKSEYLGS